MSRRTPSLAMLAALAVLVGCGPGETPAQPPEETPDETPDTTPPTSSIDTPPGVTFARFVTISASEPATIHYTLDGGDPRQAGAKTGAAPLMLEIARTTTVRFHAVDEAGNVEAESHTATYFVPVKGRIAGRIVLDPSVGRHTMALALYDRAPAQGVQPIATSPIELAAGSNETTYSFVVTTAGTYHVLAWVNLNDSGAADAGDIYASPAINPVTLDFADPLAWGVENADIYIGGGDPAFGSISGTVHVAEDLKEFPITVALLDKPLGTDGVKALGFVRIEKAGPSGNASYVLFNLRPGVGYLVAAVDTGNDGDDSNDHYALLPENPLVINLAEPSMKDRTGVDLYVGVANPNRGTVSGTLTLSAAYSGGYITVAALEGDPDGTLFMRSAARVLKNDSDTTYGYQLTDLPAGSYTLAVFYGNGRAESSRVHPAKAVIDIANAKDLTGRNFALGVGTVTGAVKVRNLKASASKVLVMARGANEATGYAQGDLGAADGNGERTFAYEIFGLDDGSWNMRALVDENGNGTVDDEGKALSLYNGAPASVTISAGSSATSDFDIAL